MNFMRNFIAITSVYRCAAASNSVTITAAYCAGVTTINGYFSANTTSVLLPLVLVKTFVKFLMLILWDCIEMILESSTNHPQ